MKLLRQLDDLPESLRGGALAIGNFDGVHRGHAHLISRLVEQARSVGGRPIVLTFDPHPVRLLRPSAAPPPLTWTERKVQLLGELGVDTVIAYPTDEALLALTPQEFFDRLIGQQLAARAIVEGPNFFFGHNRAGNIETLRALTTAAGMALEIVEPIMLDGDIVSSSRVRSLIASGQIDAACRLLTRPYRLRGMVTHGAGRGRGLGFPTANVDAVDTLLPGIGVYAGIAHVQGVAWPAAINIGPNPTFGEHAQKLEVHLIGFHDSLYGEPLEVDFLARLRDIHPFADVSALKAQLARDLATAQQIATETKTD